MSKRSCVAAESIEDAFCEWARAELLLSVSYEFCSQVPFVSLDISTRMPPIIISPVFFFAWYLYYVPQTFCAALMLLLVLYIGRPYDRPIRRSQRSSVTGTIRLNPHCVHRLLLNIWFFALALFVFPHTAQVGYSKWVSHLQCTYVFFVKVQFS